MEDYGKQLREAKTRLKLTMNQIAARAKISRNTLTRIMNGDESVLIRHIVGVAKVLGLNGEIVFSGGPVQKKLPWVGRANLEWEDVL